VRGVRPQGIIRRTTIRPVRMSRMQDFMLCQGMEFDFLPRCIAKSECAKYIPISKTSPSVTCFESRQRVPRVKHSVNDSMFSWSEVRSSLPDLAEDIAVLPKSPKTLLICLAPGVNYSVGRSFVKRVGLSRILFLCRHLRRDNPIFHHCLTCILCRCLPLPVYLLDHQTQNSSVYREPII
jgi:hypothetical protein